MLPWCLRVGGGTGRRGCCPLMMSSRALGRCQLGRRREGRRGFLGEARQRPAMSCSHCESPRPQSMSRAASPTSTRGYYSSRQSSSLPNSPMRRPQYNIPVQGPNLPRFPQAPRGLGHALDAMLLAPGTAVAAASSAFYAGAVVLRKDTQGHWTYLSQRCRATFAS